MAKLRPRARIIRTIGDQLISGPEAALIELVKNAYDADSPYALIKIVPGGEQKSMGSPDGLSPQDTSLPQYGGLISVSDAGHGMSEEQVLNNWFEPATDEKAKRRISPGGRQMLGAKGIGRFAASRLGHTTTLQTVCVQQDGTKLLTLVEINWNLFEAKKYLDEVDIPVATERLPPNSEQQTGLALTIEGLRDVWTQKRLEYLIRELRRLVSPAETQQSGFKIQLDLSSFTLDNQGFNGLDLLRGVNFSTDMGNGETEDDPFLVRPFGLQEHADYILQGSFDTEGTFVGTFVVCRGDSNPQKLSIPGPTITPEERSCGAFSLRINIYDRETAAIEALFERMGLNFNKIGIQAARRILTENAGISIFRKGFRIRPYGEPDNDWLELERQRVQDPSKKLGLSQVSGAVSILDENVSGLVERSSREGLEHNGAFERLKQLIQSVLLHVEERRFQFREKAGLSRRVKGDFVKVREAANLRRVSKAAKSLPAKYRKFVEEAAGKDAAELATELNEIDDFQRVLESRAALGLVVAEVLHEGRRILNPMASSAKTLIDGKEWVLEQSKRGEVFRHQFPEYAETIYGGVRDLGGLFKKLDPISGRKRGRPKQIGVRTVIDYCLDLFRDPITHNDIRVRIDCDATLSGYGYEGDLQAAIMNVVDNAVYWLTTVPSPRTLSIEGTRKSKWIVVRISNTGPVIDESYVPRLFDAGFSLKSDGTGLGLAIAREALRRSKSDISYDEDAPETTFVIRVPAS